MDDNETQANDQESEVYDKLALLEDLESLLEELEEQGPTAPDGRTGLSTEIRQRLTAYNIQDVQQLRSRIMHLHAELDDDDRDLTITES